MKRFALVAAVIMLCLMNESYCQTFEWNLRGGLNIMNSPTTSSSAVLLYHLGAQAGVRVASFGFYGEVLYSMNENQYEGDPIAYFIPGIITKGYWKKHLFVEIGGVLMAMTGDSGVTNDTLNPDGKAFMVAGLGANFSRIEISLRTNINQNYPMMQLTGALKF